MKNIWNRMIIFYVIAAALFFGFADLKKAYLYRLQRNDTWAMYPVDHSADPQGSNNPEPLRRGLRYYKILTHLFPHLSQGYGMLGYCYHYLYKDTKAINAFKKAIAQEPRFYWHQYNLGVIYYSRKEYQEAAECFQQIASKDFREIITSGMYNPLSALPHGKRELLFKSAADFAVKTYRDAKKYLALCTLRQGQYQQTNGLAVNLDEDEKPLKNLIIHPWVRYIPIGKEAFFAR